MLKLYSTNLIGYDQTGRSEFSLYGQDTLALYQSNLTSKGDDWYYKYNRVFYDRNSNGHRSVEASSLSSGYILFLGCSITVGSSVPLEETFPYKVSQSLDKDYYNLAVEGAGYDLVAHNLVSWFKTQPKPSLVVIRWPEMYRTFRRVGNDVFPYGPWATVDLGVRQDWKNYEKVISTDYFAHYNRIIKDMASLVSVPIVEVGHTDIVDYGRDLKHPGIQSHTLMAENVLKQI